MNIKLDINAFLFRIAHKCDGCGKITLKKIPLYHFFAGGYIDGWTWARLCKKCKKEVDE
nr:MAG: Zn finger protein [uncultured archaeon]